MLNALIDGQVTAPTKKARATCPLCGGRMIAKCGAHVTHHWAHEATIDCDPWSEPEGEWHRARKALVRPEQREVTTGTHRADIVTASGQVVELQHSSISAEEIAERCTFYHPMVWIFDVSKAYMADRLSVEWGETRYARTMMTTVEPEMRWSYGKPLYSSWTECTVCMSTGIIASHGGCCECPGVNALLKGKRQGRDILVDGIKKSYGCEKRTCADLSIVTDCQCLGRGHGVDVVGGFCLLKWEQARFDWTYAMHAGERVLLDCGADGELVEVLSCIDRRREHGGRLLAHVRVVRRASFVEWMASGKPEMSDDELRGVELYLNGRDIRRNGWPIPFDARPRRK